MRLAPICRASSGTPVLSSEATEVAGGGPAVPARDLPLEIQVTDLQALRGDGIDHHVLDVREAWELEICGLSGATHIPMAEVPDRHECLPRDELIVVLCHHGMRSERVTAWLRANGYPLATNLAGGIDAWARSIEPGLARY